MACTPEPVNIQSNAPKVRPVMPWAVRLVFLPVVKLKLKEGCPSCGLPTSCYRWAVARGVERNHFRHLGDRAPPFRVRDPVFWIYTRQPVESLQPLNPESCDLCALILNHM